MKYGDTYPISEENMSLYSQINDEIFLMETGEQKWIGQDLPLENMMAVELMLQDLQEDKIIKIRRKNHEKHGISQRISYIRKRSFL